jgi:hypothetical protein
MPYAADIPGNFYPGRKLYVSGIISTKSKAFAIDFYAGDDIAFHLNAKIADKVGRIRD